MKVLITGKNGQLGRDLVKEAEKRGFEVFAFGHEDLDVTNLDSIKQKFQEIKPDLVINATAYNLVAEAEENYEKAYALNAKAPSDMAEVCQEIGAKFVTYTTDYVFDGTKNAPYTEEDPVNPIQKYGKSKAEGEKLVTEAYPGGSFIIRTCAVYGGPEGSRLKGNIVLTILNQTKEKDFLEMAEDLTVNPTYSNDLAQATFDLLEKNPEPGIYHLVNEGVCNWVEFANETLKLVGFQKDVKGVSYTKFATFKRPLMSALANTKAKELGVVLPTWQEGLKEYISEYGLS